MPNTASATSTRRTGSSWRRSSSFRTRTAAMALPGGSSAGGMHQRSSSWSADRRSTPCSAPGLSDANLGLFGGRQRPNLSGDPTTTGSDNDRVASADNPDALYFNSGSLHEPRGRAVRQRPANHGDARHQFRKNIDLVLAKNTTFFRTHSGEIRFEILNLTNTAKFRGEDSNSIDSSSFGRITQQAGFMRIWQLAFRYRF